jgi:diguanylate cyclase (GGDEF)-like protein
MWDSGLLCGGGRGPPSPTSMAQASDSPIGILCHGSIAVKRSTAMSSDTLSLRLRRTALFGAVALVLLWLADTPKAVWVSQTALRMIGLALLVGAVSVLVETNAIKLRFGRVSLSITIVEIPLIAGFLCLAPWLHVLIRAVAQGAGNYARLKDSRRKGLTWLVLANSVQGALEVTVFTVVANHLGFTGIFSNHDLLALIGAFLTMLAVPVVLLTMFQSTREHRFPIVEVVRSYLPLHELSFVIFAIAVLFMTVFTSSSVGGILIMGLVVALVHPLRQYARLSTRAEETANLFHFSDLLSQARDGAEFSKILEHAAKTARGGESEVVLLNVSNLAPGSALVLRGETRVAHALDSLPPEWMEIMSQTQSRIMRADKPWQSARTAMAAPLLVNGDAIGLLVVSSHGDEFHNFAAEDVVILETLARHLALWLEQDRLIGALEVEIEERSNDALRDPITGLGNRAAFTNTLSELIAQDKETSVLLLNLTHFKIVNEHYGHEAGDQLLQAIGKRIRQAIPNDAFVSRLGGDEFTVCLAGASIRQAQAIADGLIRVFRKPHQVGTDEVEIGAAIGIARYPTHGTDVTMLMRSADTAMYRAKAMTEGVFTDEAPKSSVGANSLARTVQLRRAVESFRVIPHYQPLVDLRTGAVTGFEALARWQTSPGVFARPDEFIALAEETHLIHELTVQMASSALTDLAVWRRIPGYEALTVSLNISPVSLGRQDVTEQLLSILAQLALPADALTLEITESRVMEDPERSIRHLRSLAAEGLKLAIDDFGAGQTSLSYLADLPVHQLKIDRKFLLEAVEKTSARRLLATMIALGRDLEQMVTVEGIETSGHWYLVRDLGAHKAQGYFVAKAMPTSATAEWLRMTAPHLLENLGITIPVAVGHFRK